MGTDRHSEQPRGIKAVGWYSVLITLSAIILFPIYTTIVRSLSSAIPYINSLKDGSGLVPVAVDYGVFGRVLQNDRFVNAMLLSAAISLIIVTGQVLTSTLAAYAFVFLEFPFKKLAFAVLVGTLLLPIEVTIMANIETIRDIAWLNSIQGLTVPFLASAFGIFLIRQAFLGIPSELRDAADLEGYSHLRFLFRVAVPISKPIIGSFVLISFLGAWNQYLWPRFAADKESLQTIQVALRNLGKSEITDLNFGYAAALLSAVPLLIILIAFQRQLVRGLTAGAVKG